MTDPDLTDRDLVPLGRVGRPFGVKGDLRVRPYNLDTTWFDDATTVWLRPDPAGPPAAYRVLHARRHKPDEFILALDGVRDRDRAEALRGFEVVAPKSALPPLEEDEYYWTDLIGLRVSDEAGRGLGEVVRLEETSRKLDGPDVLIVQTDRGEAAVPLAAAYIKAIDLPKRRLTVTAIIDTEDDEKK